MLYLRSWAYFYLFLPFLSLLLNFDDMAVTEVFPLTAFLCQNMREKLPVADSLYCLSVYTNLSKLYTRQHPAFLIEFLTKTSL